MGAEASCSKEEESCSEEESCTREEEERCSEGASKENKTNDIKAAFGGFIQEEKLGEVHEKQEVQGKVGKSTQGTCGKVEKAMFSESKVQEKVSGSQESNEEEEESQEEQERATEEESCSKEEGCSKEEESCTEEEEEGC